MIVDTSALAAIVFGEAGSETLKEAIIGSPSFIPSTVLTELQLAMQKGGANTIASAEALIHAMSRGGTVFLAFEKRHAEITQVARDQYGNGNGKGGKLNFGDLMVYAIAKDRGEPVLCTGSDFASTDIAIHPASRFDP